MATSILRTFRLTSSDEEKAILPTGTRPQVGDLGAELALKSTLVFGSRGQRGGAGRDRGPAILK